MLQLDIEIEGYINICDGEILFCILNFFTYCNKHNVEWVFVFAVYFDSIVKFTGIIYRR